MAKKKIKDRPVTKESTAGKQLVIQELNVMSADRSRKDIGDWKNSLQSAESIHFPNRTRLYDLYADAILDGFLAGVINKRVDAVLNKALHFNNAADKRNDEFAKLINSSAFRELIRLIMHTQGWGISGAEFIPGAQLNFKPIPRKHIKPDKKIISYEQNDNSSGIPYEGLSNVWIMGDEKDLGYLLLCSIYVLYKRGGLADYAQFVEIFGQPVRVIKYDAYDTKTRIELRQILDESGSSLALMIPKQAEFEMMDGKTANANGDLQLKFLKYIDDHLSVIVLGNTETTRSSASSGYAQSETHQAQQLEITKSDMKYVLGYLNSDHFRNILKMYGFPVEGGEFEYEKEINLDELKKRVEIDKEIVTSLKTPIDDEYVYDTYGIPKPKNYDELKAKQEAERQAALNPPAPDPADPQKKRDPAKGQPKGNSKDSPLRQKLNAWDNLLAHISDFFDQAR